jgi:hypothetical protein
VHVHVHDAVIVIQPVDDRFTMRCFDRRGSSPQPVRPWGTITPTVSFPFPCTSTITVPITSTSTIAPTIVAADL